MSNSDTSENNENAPESNSGEQPPRNVIIKAWDGFKKYPAEWITAGATVALAGLALGAWLEAIAARNIAQSQLIAGSAAFVFLEKADIVPDTSGPKPLWWFIPRFRNSGETPTLGLRINVSSAIFPGNVMPKGYYLTTPTIEQPIIDLGPKASIETAFLPFSPAGLSFKPRYFWGWATYKDTIEKRDHITRFCYAMVGWEGNPNFPVGEAAAPLLLSVEKQLAQSVPTGQPATAGPNSTNAAPPVISPQEKAAFLNLAPFKPIFQLCAEGNCRDDECAQEAKQYSARE